MTLKPLKPHPTQRHADPLAFVATSAVTAAGIGRAALADALQAHRHALRANTVSSRPLATMVGEVMGLDDVRLPEALMSLDARNHRLAWLGLQADGFAQAAHAVIERVGAQRVGVVMGTSTSSMGETEAAYRMAHRTSHPPTPNPALHQLHSLGTFVAAALGAEGPSMTVSTACSSSAKALGVAQWWLNLGWVDAAVVGGVDSLCDSVLFGFDALQLVAPIACQPFDVKRAGINLGEAAAFALMQRVSDAPAQASRLLAVGESSDAHHMTAPQPNGEHIEAALRQALLNAELAPDDIDYINLHGTATPHNDPVEAAMLERVFARPVHASSTKGCTGHTLGASGLVEAIVCLLAMERGFKPGTVNTRELDPVAQKHVQLNPVSANVRVALSNAFGFGGTNTVLVLGGAR